MEAIQLHASYWICIRPLGQKLLTQGPAFNFRHLGAKGGLQAQMSATTVAPWAVEA